MSTPQSYENSHKEAGKGVAYDCYYDTEPWARFLWERERRVLEAFLREYFDGREIRLLDFACGSGRLTSFLEDRVTTSVGVDVSPSMLEVARDKLNRTELIEANLIEEDVLEGRKFDLITAFRFFLNAEPALRKGALAVLASHLAEDGYLVINNHRNRSSPLVLARLLYHRMTRGTCNFMSMAEMKRLVEGAGLVIERVYPVGVFSVPRFTLSEDRNHKLDDFVLRRRYLSFFCESPIVICRRP